MDATTTKGQLRRDRTKAIIRGAEQLAQTYGSGGYALRGKQLLRARRRLQSLLLLYSKRFYRFPSAVEIREQWKRVAGLYARTR
jgi:hypothetical protein